MARCEQFVSAPTLLLLKLTLFVAIALLFESLGRIEVDVLDVVLLALWLLVVNDLELHGLQRYVSAAAV